MSKRRLTFGAAALLAVAIAVPSAQAPTLDEVLKRMSIYVATFRQQLSGIVAEETYFQEIADTSRSAGGFGTKQTRTLKSDLLLLRPADADRYVELRDVFELNGEPVRDRQTRLEKLLGEGSAGAQASISSIITQSARYNLGNIVRNINTPLPVSARWIFQPPATPRRRSGFPEERLCCIRSDMRRLAWLSAKPPRRTRPARWRTGAKPAPGITRYGRRRLRKS